MRSETADVRLQGLIRGVGLVTVWRRDDMPDEGMLRRQALVWTEEQIDAWWRWMRIGQDGFLAFFVVWSLFIVLVVTRSNIDPLAALITATMLVPEVAWRYRRRKGWL